VSSPVSTAGQGRDKPFGILYVKGASVIRALAALIGDDALRRGLGEYLDRFAFSSETLDDLVGCWSRASGHAFWLLVTSGELPAAQFTEMAGRRLQEAGLPEVGIETLLSRAIEAADAWAPPHLRAGHQKALAQVTAESPAVPGDAHFRSDRRGGERRGAVG
jgi:hypothetical protein